MTAFDCFVDYINEYLILHSESLTSFSHALKMDYSMIRYWLIGARRPTLDSLVKVADHCNVSIDYMLGLSDNPNFNRSTNSQDFADRLTSLLKQSDITQYRLAKDCDTERSVISKWLLRKTVPKPEKIIMIAKYFSVSFDYLIGRVD